MTIATVSQVFSNYFFLSIVGGIPLYGYFRKVRVFDAFVDGAKESITLLIKIIPYLVGMIVAIGMLRASGALDHLATWLAPLLHKIGMPADVLPLALMRPFSGTAATGMMAEVIHDNGGNAFVSKVAATMMGSTETTFYVIAIYFGAVRVHRTRYAVPAGLIADLVGIIAAVFVCRMLFL